uniref:Uncharacterized protein n=1 Tax=Anguilla anguilla TaxID=7936 RepID=A0A0E9TRF5_ANGAN
MHGLIIQLHYYYHIYVILYIQTLYLSENNGTFAWNIVTKIKGILPCFHRKAMSHIGGLKCGLCSTHLSQ